MEMMQKQMESLMDLVKESKKKGIVGPNLHVKLVVLTEKDDIEAHLVSIERIMEAY